MRAQRLWRTPPTLRNFREGCCKTPSCLACEKNSPIGKNEVREQASGERNERAENRTDRRKTENKAREEAVILPANVKALENLNKHLTANERQSRETAEGEVLPKRERVRLKPPAYVKKDEAALRYWKQTVKRMEGITLLDDLDTEIFALYCCQLARWERLNGQVSDLDTMLAEGGGAKALKLLADASEELRKLESGIASYADRLGLTPKSRIGLTRSIAKERELDSIDPLFGD